MVAEQWSAATKMTGRGPTHGGRFNVSGLHCLSYHAVRDFENWYSVRIGGHAQFQLLKPIWDLIGRLSCARPRRRSRLSG